MREEISHRSGLAGPYRAPKGSMMPARANGLVIPGGSQSGSLQMWELSGAMKAAG